MSFLINTHINIISYIHQSRIIVLISHHPLLFDLWSASKLGIESISSLINIQNACFLSILLFSSPYIIRNYIICNFYQFLLFCTPFMNGKDTVREIWLPRWPLQPKFIGLAFSISPYPPDWSCFWDPVLFLQIYPIFIPGELDCLVGWGGGGGRELECHYRASHRHLLLNGLPIISPCHHCQQEK